MIPVLPGWNWLTSWEKTGKIREPARARTVLDRVTSGPAGGFGRLSERVPELSREILCAAIDRFRPISRM